MIDDIKDLLRENKNKIGTAIGGAITALVIYLITLLCGCVIGDKPVEKITECIGQYCNIKSNGQLVLDESLNK